MFRAIISSILDALDCVYSLWYNAPTMMPAGDQNGVELWYKAPKMLPAGDQDEVEFHLSLVTSRHHRRCIIPQAVNTV